MATPSLRVCASGSLAAVALFLYGGHGFAVFNTGSSALRGTASPQLVLPRRPEGPAPDEPKGSASTFVLVASVAALAGALRTRVQRRVVYGSGGRVRDQAAKETKRTEYFGKNFTPGERGYNSKGVTKKPAPALNRMVLEYLRKPIMKYSTSDFYKSPHQQLSFAGVKEVGTYMTTPDAPKDYIVPAEVPEYKQPKMGLRLEKESGFEKPPGKREHEAYVQMVDQRTGLADAAKAVAAKQSMSLDKDIICERTALTLLLEYLNETFHTKTSCDLVKVSKGPNGKGLVLERLFDKNKMVAEQKPYRGAWRRSEVSNHGNYLPAWERAAHGDMTNSMMITGIKQIAGSTAGESNATYRFVEYTLGGLSFLTRVRSYVKENGANVELKSKNFYFQDQVTMLYTYYNLLLGGVDQLTMAIHRSGKIVQVLKCKLEDLVNKQAQIVPAAERRMGRLVALLKDVQEEVAKDGEGPWVLQWSKDSGKLLLGQYAPPTWEGTKANEVQVVKEPMTA
ncbi:unnamed protein product [Polarella glacialis]|uniref:Uncharacterized protein n=1 Tax=Polarella glacialis TaxID=89957 RepID=A0A813FIK5_POLGL|nr:unnamed protein product [Polarella glacialis]CAE8704521.1 unnamed protein product [Polarella glacialis]